MSTPKIIAFYLPQYHPTPDNDKWWGKGFTEWTNVGKAKPLFRGHYQPKVPADLGYYDLRLPEVREAQAELAKEAGIYGFCYYHYWFGNGKEELELPFNEVLRLGKPDFPFMLCWANESWHKKFWNKDGVGSSKEVLIEQTYPGEQDHIDHFYRLLPAFKDSRYIKIDGKLLFMIYNPFEMHDAEKFIKIWNELSLKEDIGEFYFIAQIQEKFTLSRYENLQKIGFNGINTVGLFESLRKTLNSPLGKFIFKFKNKFLRKPLVRDYNKVASNFITDLDSYENVFPTIIPNWDHTPRSGAYGWVLKNSNPDNFRKHLNHILSFVKKEKKNDILFLKSWNEWGEGNYIEPDLIFGREYLEVINKELKNYP